MPQLPKQHVQINSLPLPDKGQVDYFGTDKDLGLMLRVSHTGRKTWFVRYYIPRKGKSVRAKYNIGRFPGIELKKARGIKGDILSKVEQGQDPAEEKKVTERKTAIKTVEALCAQFFEIRSVEKYRGRVRRNVNDEQSMARCYIIPSIGSYAPDTVTQDDILELLYKAQETCSGVRANRILALLRVLFKYALKSKYVDVNPTEGVTPPSTESAREIDPPMSGEIKELWQRIEGKIQDEPKRPVLISKQIQIALKLLLVTGQRSSEVSQAPIDEFDLEDRVWIISGSRTKNGKSHKVPLSDMAYDLVTEAIKLAKKEAPDSPFLFPGWTGRNGHKRGELSIGKTACYRALKRVTEGTKLDRFSVHDFRKICASQMVECGVALEVVSEILNHTINTVTAKHYARPNYMPQKREALNLWGAKLGEVVNKN